jgi:hypothetical protein
MPTFTTSMDALRRAARQLGPYVLIEALLPGGTLLALLLLLYRQRRSGLAPARLLDLFSPVLARRAES